MSSNWQPKFTYYPDPILRRVAKPIDSITPDIIELFDILKNLCIEHEGVGLAGQQIGIIMPTIVFGVPEPRSDETDDTPTKYNLIGVANPKVIWESDETEIREEGCLSFPGIYAPVERPLKIIAEGWFDDTKKFERRELCGIVARIFMHETDHTQGILFIDRIDEVSREMIKPKLTELADIGGEKIVGQKVTSDL